MFGSCQTNTDLMSSGSKFPDRILRHEPELIDIQLNPHGWVQIEELQ